ncbi:hypothetical protein HHX47_DHR5000306 [Lentinula edodes]|nr:hypothetical protein HHX47_DHR5000306 [Lentinula edodes]
MTIQARSSKKRKQHGQDESADTFNEAVNLEMFSDEEDREDVDSDNGEVDEFPEIDAGSDESGEEDETYESEEDTGASEEGSSSGSQEQLHIFPEAKTIVSDITGQEKRVYPEIEPDYDSDSSTEDTPNRVGDIPMHWYDDLPHVGYDMDGKRVLKPARGDELDRFLKTVEDPNSWQPRTSAFDKKAQADKPLTAEELDIIRRLYANENPDANYDPSSSNAPPLPAPKPSLPTNSESYNPPEEYLPTEEDKKQWEETDPEDREHDYLPQKYSALRLVPGYERFIKDRFNRQLDLYMAPRVQRVKLNIDPNSLIPKLPSPSSLKPFPTYKSLQVVHTHIARCISVSPDGAWVVSGDEGGVVRLWEVNVGREVRKWKFDGKIGSIEWCPRTDVSYFVVGTSDDMLHFLIPPNLPASILQLTQSTLAPSTLPPAAETPSPVKWSTPSSNTWTDETAVLTIHLPPSSGLPTQITWHRRGDYLASVSIGGSQGAVWIHQVSRRHSQAPFKKVRGKVQLVLFHPMKPCFFVATQQYVRMYNLSEQKLLKTLQPGIKWISSMDVHPSGDHLIVGGYDRKLCWFDLELSDKPYKVLRYHTRAIRSLHFHPTYPLFASSSDDGAIQIFHSRVYNDLMTDPLIVPLKILRGHEITKGLGVLQVKWCSRHPWLVSGGADGAVNMMLYLALLSLDFIFFFLSRYCILLAFVGIIVSLSVTTRINCGALYVFNSWAGNMTLLCSSTSLMLRTVALWERKLTVVVPLVRADWSDIARSCVVTSTEPSLLNVTFFFTMGFDFVILVYTYVALVTKHTARTDLWKLLFHDGLVYFLVTFCANCIPAVFNVLNLNTPMNVVATTPAAAVSSIASCRAVMRLLDYTSGDVYVHSVSGAAMVPKFATARPEVLVTTEHITMSEFVTDSDSPYTKTSHSIGNDLEIVEATDDHKTSRNSSECTSLV